MANIEKQIALQRTVKISRMPQHELVDMVLRLEKEADWLALKQANCPSEFRIKGCQSDNINDAICTQCWREAARKAVQDD